MSNEDGPHKEKQAKWKSLSENEKSKYQTMADRVNNGEQPDIEQ